MPKISVIMPVYNGEKYIREAIDSILTQTYADFEFLIIDDGSTDASPQIVRSYNDPRIRFHQNEHNMGVAATLNRGLDLAEGEYIARMDADDISLPQRFAKQVEYMDSHPKVAVCGCGIQLTGAQCGERLFAQTPAQMKVDMLFSCGLAHPTVFMRSTVFGKNGLHYDERFSKLEDYALWVETLRKHEIVCIPDILFRYRIHPGQVTQNYSPVFHEQFRALKGKQMEQMGLSNGEEGFELFVQFCEGRELSKEETVHFVGWLHQIRETNQKLKIYDSNWLNKTVNGVISHVLDHFPLQQAARLAGYCGKNAALYAVKRASRNGLIKLKRTAAMKRRQHQLRCRDFTIFSNNCWGSFIYQKYGLQYRSPTAGLYIPGDDFVRFCADWQTYLKKKLEFIPWENTRLYPQIKDQRPYPVALLGDVEIYFMHYHSEQEAREKWIRRCTRVNPERVIFKLSQRECCERTDVERFLSLPLEHKICFAYDEVPGAVLIPELRGLVGDEQPLAERYFDELDYLNRL